MERAKEIGGHALWLLGHLLFTVVTVCSIRGGNSFWEDYKSWVNPSFEVNYQDLELDSLKRMQKDVAAELKFRLGN